MNYNTFRYIGTEGSVLRRLATYHTMTEVDSRNYTMYNKGHINNSKLTDQASVCHRL